MLYTLEIYPRESPCQSIGIVTFMAVGWVSSCEIHCRLLNVGVFYQFCSHKLLTRIALCVNQFVFLPVYPQDGIQEVRLLWVKGQIQSTFAGWYQIPHYRSVYYFAFLQRRMEGTVPSLVSEQCNVIWPWNNSCFEDPSR